MINHNFELVNYDTDSITICNKNGSPFSEQQKNDLLTELNSLFSENIVWEDDGYFDKIVVVAAKNYALYDGKKIKIKGSALKASTKCPALKEALKTFIDTIVYIEDTYEMYNKLQEQYNSYVAEIMNLTDMKRWSSRKTYSSTMVTSTRTNETKVMDALKGSKYVEGDRFNCFYLPDDSLCLVENFAGNYHKGRLLKNLYDTVNIFETVLPIKELFVNYALKKNLKLLE